MAVQDRVNKGNFSFVLKGGRTRNNETVAQDVGRAADLEQYTIMAKDPATNKWVPHTSLVAVDGTEIPRGIIMCTIPTADLVAGDVGAVPILVGNVDVDRAQVIADDGTAIETWLASEITNQNTTVEDALAQAGIYLNSTRHDSSFEN